MTRTKTTPQAASAKALLAALDRLPLAFALFDGKRRLAAWNAPLAALGLFPKSLLKQGAPFAEFQRRDPGLKRKAPGPHDVSLPMGEVYQVSRRRVPPGQLLVSYEDVTEARLARAEAAEALERQTATAEILRVISSSPTDTQPVFEAIVQSGLRLFAGAAVFVGIVEGDALRAAAAAGFAAVAGRVVPVTRESAGGIAILDRKVVNIRDTEASDAPLYARENGRSMNVRSMTQMPMFREGQAIGTIGVLGREPGGLDEKQLALLKTFADQAVIAIENVRLFKELEARNRDVTDALERQTATAEILRVISSSPNDVQPVFDTIVRNFVSLCGSMFGAVFKLEGGLVHYAGSAGFNPEQREGLRAKYPVRVDDPTVASARAIFSKAPVHIQDIQADPHYDREHAATAGWRRMLAVPMLRDGEPLGAIVANWAEAGATPKQQEDLLKTFADQAVIAIENVRLFNETKEALERQTATAEILKVISGSPTDTQPVFEEIVQSAARLFVPWNAAILMREGNLIYRRALTGPRVLSREEDEIARNRWPMPFDPEKVVTARVIADVQTVQILDTEAPDVMPGVKETGRAGKYRSIVWVPLVRDGEGIGSIVLTHAQAGYALSGKQLALIRTFADQAVIAIENVRLFKELQQRTEALTKSVGQLTALGEVGQAISSTLDLETVLQTIVQRAVQLTGLDGGSIYEYDERSEEFRLQASDNQDPELLEAIRRAPIRKGDGTVGGTAVTLEATQVPDILDAGYQSSRKELLIRAGYRAILTVPLLRDDRVIGALSVTRKTPGPFAPEVVELLKTFATQSAMAMQNARLFREIAEKGKQLEVASQHKSNFLASMSHELRTPLNAILGFNEMIIGQVYGEVPADMQEPLNDIQTSGKHLLRLINNVLDLAKIEAGRMELSLQDYSVHDTVASVHSTLRPLAAEKGLEFLANVPNDVPLAYGDGGRITQCLMNLAGNSLKFTKAGKVEISVETKGELLVYKVTDTGIGIPPDKIGTLFTEFKQTDATIASEYGGTGLGLSISRKFVEMHGGRIWVESELGKGSAFIIEVPLRVKTP